MPGVSSTIVGLPSQDLSSIQGPLGRQLKASQPVERNGAETPESHSIRFAVFDAVHSCPAVSSFGRVTTNGLVLIPRITSAAVKGCMNSFFYFSSGHVLVFTGLLAARAQVAFIAANCVVFNRAAYVWGRGTP